MRIVLDLQACQSNGSRHRGIGRYSYALAQAMAQQAQHHEVHIVLNSAQTAHFQEIKTTFQHFIPAERIHAFTNALPVADGHPENHWRTRVAEHLRERFIMGLQPDIVHVASLFEGLVDETVTSIIHDDLAKKSAATLYDLIPLVYHDKYLADPNVRNWYYRKLQALKNAALGLAISDYSRLEAIDLLGLAPDRVVNISGATTAEFKPLVLSEQVKAEILGRYGISRPFLMYTGEVDYRKNAEGLIEAYSLLSPELRQQYQLVVIGRLPERDRQRLFDMAKKYQVDQADLVLTGFVPDEELIIFYNLARLFVFPSRYEGFGLPVLESMACGTPAIAGNNSSLPEILGLDDAMFDADKPAAIAQKITQALTDPQFYQILHEHGLRQARLFSWDASAKRALDAFEAEYDRQQVAARTSVAVMPQVWRPRMAFFTPLPPEKSGIADYSALLLPVLARYYDIDVITDQEQIDAPWVQANFPIRSVVWFKANHQRYERKLYQIGNSAFHMHMFDLLREFPGAITLHDFFLINVMGHMDSVNYGTPMLAQAVYRSHGYQALHFLKTAGYWACVKQYPANKTVLDYARGVIVHSRFSKQLGQQWYGADYSQHWAVIPMLRTASTQMRQAVARQKLGLDSDAIVICSFGMLAPTKLNHRLLDAWLASPLSQNPRCQLVFVGDMGTKEYGESLYSTIQAAAVADRIRITHFVSMDDYELWLKAADIGVQLRTDTRGETSASLLDCLASGLPLIFNGHATADEIPDVVAVKLPDHFTDAELMDSLLMLVDAPQQRQQLSELASEHIRHHHSPAHVAERYRDAIEAFHADHPLSQEDQLVQAIQALRTVAVPNDQDLATTAECIVNNRLFAQGHKSLLVDVSSLQWKDFGSGVHRVTKAILKELLLNPPLGYRVEPVYVLNERYYYARALTGRLLELNDFPLTDEAVEFKAGDVFLGLDLILHTLPLMESVLCLQRARGVKVYWVVYDLLPVLMPQHFNDEVVLHYNNWLQSVTKIADGLLCISATVADELRAWCDGHVVNRPDVLRIGHFHMGADISPSVSSTGLADNYDDILNTVKDTCAVLMETLLELLNEEQQLGHEQLSDTDHPLDQDDQLLAVIQAEPAVVVPNDQDVATMAECSIHDLPFLQGQKSLLVDVSSLQWRDFGSGVHRVTKAILRELLLNPPAGYRVEPVHAQGKYYSHAGTLTARLLGLKNMPLTDEAVEFKPGDVFLGLDLALHTLPLMEPVLSLQRVRGVKIYWVVYDMLPVSMPKHFSDDLVFHYSNWLKSVTKIANGLLCISASVADELKTWCDVQVLNRPDMARIGYFHMGADIRKSLPSVGLPANHVDILNTVKDACSVLMVSTVESRKGYQQTLYAFEQLWRKGVDITLVIVGQAGWKTEALQAKIRSHPEIGKRLFWLAGISDEMLLKLYEHCSVLLAAAEGEGFGLPLIEAAQHGLPIIARDLPVFKEVAGEHAFYFHGQEPHELADAIQQWLTLWQTASIPQSEGISWLTWAESAAQLKAFVVGQG